MDRSTEIVKRVKEIDNGDEVTFAEEIRDKRYPVILKNAELGPCLTKWSGEYLKENMKNKDVKIHVSTNPQLDFLRKNFLYKSIKLDELIHRIYAKSEATNDAEHFLDKNEYYYLRSLGENPRKDVADVSKDFPILVEDVRIPEVFPPENFFSSVFRIASPGVQLWTHYDIMDNILLQIRGKKRVILFSPEDTPNLYLIGDKSAVIDVDDVDERQFPKFKNAVRYECHLEPGDVLFIPALWFHNVTSVDVGIAVNVFWRHLDASVYDKKDTYGNKDLLPAMHAFQCIEKAAKHLLALPREYEQFYLHRLVSKLQEKINVMENGEVIKTSHE